MNKNKRNAKIATSLNERSLKTKMSKDDSHFTINVMSRGKDGKKGTDDDKTERTNKIKVRGDHSPHPLTHKYKSEALEFGTDKTSIFRNCFEIEPNSPIPAMARIWPNKRVK